MNVSELNSSKYFANFLERHGIDTVFTVSGGSIHNVLFALDSSESINLVPCYNEQGAVYAAEGYARATGKVGVCLVTSGPGLTNIITGINCCWVDSVPLFVLAGQVVEKQKLIHLPLPTRQRGVQESESEGLVRSIVKAYSSVQDPNDFPTILESLWSEATTKRYGPVVLELPVDMSYKPISTVEDIQKLKDHQQTKKNSILGNDNIKELINAFNQAKLPLILFGNGIRDCQDNVKYLASLLNQKNIAYLSTWGSKDIIENGQKCDLYFGSPGIFGSRKANALLHYSDCILSIGCSLGYTHTGYRVSNLNPASLHIIDIDPAQFEKPELKDANKYLVDAVDLIEGLIPIVEEKKEISNPNQIFSHLFTQYDKADQAAEESSKYLALIKKINHYLQTCQQPSDYIFCTDMGTSFTATHSYLNCHGSKIFTAAGHAPMGWGLPGAVGAAFGCPQNTVICLSGDGGLLMNIQELMHISHYKLNIKLIVINNGGYATIMNTTTRYHNRTVASSPTNGIVNPKFEKIAAAYSIPYMALPSPDAIKDVLKTTGPMMIEFVTDPNDFIGPKLMMSDGKINELVNMNPFLDESLLGKQTISL